MPHVRGVARIRRATTLMSCSSRTDLASSWAWIAASRTSAAVNPFGSIAVCFLSAQAEITSLRMRRPSRPTQCFAARSNVAVVQDASRGGKCPGEFLDRRPKNGTAGLGPRHTDVLDQVGAGKKRTVHRPREIARGDEQEVWVLRRKLVQLREHGIRGTVDVNRIGVHAHPRPVGGERFHLVEKHNQRAAFCLFGDGLAHQVTNRPLALTQGRTGQGVGFDLDEPELAESADGLGRPGRQPARERRLARSRWPVQHDQAVQGQVRPVDLIPEREVQDGLRRAGGPSGPSPR